MCRTLSMTLALVGSLVAGAPADEVDDMVETYITEEGLPGLALAVVRDGKVVKEAAYGLADVELDCPATVETVYEIGSMTKSFTAMLVMMLVEEGKLDVDDPITDHLDDLPAAWEEVTIRHLLNHTSGIKNYTSVGSFVAIAREDHTAEEILDLVADAPLDFEPGAQYRYCNTGYYLLGLIIEKIEGQPFAEVLEDRILGPLEMDRTQPSNPRKIIPGRAKGYGTVMGLVRVNRDPITPSSAFAAGFLVSTVGDMALWNAALREGKFLKPESYEKMYAPALLSDGSTHPYGYGWVTTRKFGHRLLGHGGGTAGFASLLSRYPEDGLTLILLCNQADADLGTLRSRLARHYLPGLDIASAEPIDDPEPETSKHLHAVMADLLADELDRDAFTTTMADHLASEDGRATTRSVARNGELESFALISREVKDQGATLRYRAAVGEAVYLFTIHLTDDDRISGLWLEKVD